MGNDRVLGGQGSESQMPASYPSLDGVFPYSVPAQGWRPCLAGPPTAPRSTCPQESEWVREAWGVEIRGRPGGQ